MKTKIIALLAVFASGVFSCEDEEKIEDPIYEFASFAGDEAVDIGEADEGYPLVVQLWAFDPYAEDLTVDYDITGTNAEKDVDFTVTPANSITIKAGSLVSDTIWVNAINNGDANELERTFEVNLNAISESSINLGLGISEPTNDIVTFKILDDECSGDAICVFNSDLTNNISGNEKPASGVVDKINSTVTVTGDLIDYDVFSSATLMITLTPSAPGSSSGTASFGEQETGTDSDGYQYKFVEVGTGTYDADAGVINIEYDIYYLEGDWVYWYSVSNEFSTP